MTMLLEEMMRRLGINVDNLKSSTNPIDALLEEMRRLGLDVDNPRAKMHDYTKPLLLATQDSFLGFVPEWVQPDETVTIVSGRLLSIFKPRRLLIPDYMSGAFVINDIRFGSESLFSGSSGSMLATLFSEEKPGVPFDFRTLTPGDVVSIVVTNVDGIAPRRFRCSMIGKEVKEAPVAPKEET